MYGWWLADRDHGRLGLTELAAASQEQFDTGMARVQEFRAKDPDRRRPAPTSVARFEVYGSVNGTR
jgi:hypothetical protein